MNAHLSSSLCLPIAELSSRSECKPSSSLPITNTRVSLSEPKAGSQPFNVPWPFSEGCPREANVEKLRVSRIARRWSEAVGL